eukprot:scaffold4343_cov144-Cylindrotheca_fusiformis.AAC.11
MAMKAKLMQAVSAIVRNHEVAESVFCNLPQSPALLAEGLNVQSSKQLKSRTLFFFRALITSDTAGPTRSELFASAIIYIIDNYLDESNPADLREMAIELLEQLLQRKLATATILKRKDFLAALGVSRISSLRSLSGEEKEYAASELEHWESFMILLARAE